MNIRIGTGYDLHRLVEGRELFLGGVHIPFSKGLSGHSDADVLLHSICDALLGACACGDIGMHFPDTDKRFKGMTGSALVEKTFKVIKKKKKRIHVMNIDTVVICDKPNLSAYRKKIEKSVAALLGIQVERVCLKAKTTEKTSKDTISSYAVVLLRLHSSAF